MALERDILQWVERRFSPDDAPKVIEQVSAVEKSSRVIRCIVFVANGNMERLCQMIEMARHDERDVIVAGEYDRSGRRRDLRVSFLIDSPEKMWISSMAVMLALRGYTLASIETAPADRRGAKYPTDFFEGTASFVGDIGELRVCKRNGCWSLAGDPADLDAYNVSGKFEDARAFEDAVSGYILVKRKRTGVSPPSIGSD